MIKLVDVAFVILVFFILNILVIVKFQKRQDSFEEYSVGSRSFGWLLYSFSFLGYWYTGTLYLSGFSLSASRGVFAQYLTVYSVASLAVLYFMAKPVWVWGKKYNLVTQADFIGLRYGSKLFKTIFSVITFSFWFPWIIIEIKTVGHIASLATYSRLDANAGMIIVCLFVIVYTFYGGVRASANASIIQATAFIGLDVILSGALIWKLFGGAAEIFPLVEAAKPSLLVLDAGEGGGYWASILLTGTLGAFAYPDMFKQLYTADSPRTIRKIVFLVPVVSLLGTLSLLLGLGGSLMPGFPVQDEYSLFWFADIYGGPILLSLYAIIPLSASMSTFSAVINTSAVMVCKDFIGTVKKGLSSRDMLRYAKGLTIIIGILSLYIATIRVDNLMNIALIMFDLIVQAIIPLFVGLYWKKSNLPGAFGGMAAGIAIALIGNFYPQTFLWAEGWSPGMVGLAVNLAIHVICGLAFGRQSHVDELFDAVNEYGDPRFRIG
jgi:SSS family solute:Na+ symporter